MASKLDMPAKYLRLKEKQSEEFCPECGVPRSLWPTLGYRLVAVVYCGHECAESFLARSESKDARTRKQIK
jgi:hypothetical protein